MVLGFLNGINFVLQLDELNRSWDISESISSQRQQGFQNLCHLKPVGPAWVWFQLKGVML